MRDRSRAGQRGLWRVVTACVAVQTSLALAGTGDWPQWRGPSRDGVAVGVELPDSLPATLKQLWQIEVGAGYSGPVVSGDKVVVLSRQGDDEVVQCLNASDGKVLWRSSCSAPYDPASVAKRHGKGPFSTPTIAGGKVYTFGVTGVLNCLDLGEGKVVWRQDFKGRFKKTYPSWGAANSPLVEGNLCILGVGAKQEGGLAAFDVETGKAVWQQAIDGAAYSSPVAADLAGQKQVVALMENKLVGVELTSGKPLWSVPFVVQYEQNVITPVVSKDMVVIAGWQQGTLACRIGADGAKEAWKNEAESMYLSSPVPGEKHLFGLCDRGGGSLVCLSLEEGKTLWSSPGRLGEYASVVRAGDKLLVLTTKGELLLVAADPAQYKELGRVRATERPVYAHLALAGGQVYVKDNSHVTCLELPAK